MDAQMTPNGPTPEQEKEDIKQDIKRILDGYALTDYLIMKPDVLRKTLHEQNYSWPGLALYIDSLSPVDQYYLLIHGFSENQRKTIWPYQSDKSDLASPYNLV